jgi:hypothetical protein
MAMRRDNEVASLRKKAGITEKTSKEEAVKLLQKAGVEPAKGKEKMLLEHIIGVAMGSDDDDGVVPCLQRELSGERDGDGYWGGSYPVSKCISKLEGACRDWLDWEVRVRRARRVLEENENPRAVFDDEYRD